VVDSLKVLDPKRPIREADKFGAGQHFAFVPGAEVNTELTFSMLGVEVFTSERPIS